MSAIVITKNRVSHNHMKHIEIKNHFVWKLIYKEEIKLDFCKVGKQVMHIFIKSILIEKFNKFRKMLGIYDFSRLKGSVKNQN